MFYCSNCGTSLNTKTKFCTSCGTKIRMTPKDIEELPKRKIDKGEVNSLEEEATNNLKSKINKTVSPKIPKENQTIAENIKSNQPVAQKALKQKWMLYYILFNIPLYFINTGDDEILGVLIFSTIVFIGFLIYSLQKEKGKPYPIVLKIILVLQSLLAVSGIMQRLEYIGSSVYSLVAVISLALLVFLNIKIIFRRNK